MLDLVLASSEDMKDKMAVGNNLGPSDHELVQMDLIEWAVGIKMVTELFDIKMSSSNKLRALIREVD